MVVIRQNSIPLTRRVRGRDYIVAIGLLIALIFVADLLYRAEYERQHAHDNIVYDDRPKSIVAVVIMIDNSSWVADASLAKRSVECYTELQNYKLHFIDFSKNRTLLNGCEQTDIMFARHCALRNLMFEIEEEFVLFLDADIGVVNPMHRIEEWIPKDPETHIVFYDRFYNKEITAGTYIVRNSARGRRFLKFWADYFYRMPDSFHGTDNGALHNAVIEFFMPSLVADKKKCEKIWNRSKNYEDLFDFETCIRMVMDQQEAPGFKILEKGTGWARDVWLAQARWAANDFMLHGWKQLFYELEGNQHWWTTPFVDSSFKHSCKGAWGLANWNYNSSLIVSPKRLKDLLLVMMADVEVAYIRRQNRLRSNGMLN